VCSAVLGCSVHTSNVLCIEVFAIEVVVIESVFVFVVHARFAEIASPKAQLDVLCTDVPLPLVLR
jgi:hypothetical protein